VVFFFLERHPVVVLDARVSETEGGDAIRTVPQLHPADFGVKGAEKGLELAAAIVSHLGDLAAVVAAIGWDEKAGFTVAVMPYDCRGVHLPRGRELVQLGNSLPRSGDEDCVMDNETHDIGSGAGSGSIVR
jgi:hypothetical protein